MKEARFQTPCEGGAQCLLCPHHCRIKEGGRGICRSRECRNGTLYALSYGAPCALAVDPVEKKPLHRFMPGTHCLSLSCTGCNLSCRWCQNSAISQVAPEEADHAALLPEEVVNLCLRRGLPSLAFTYTEPFTRPSTTPSTADTAEPPSPPCWTTSSPCTRPASTWRSPT